MKDILGKKVCPSLPDLYSWKAVLIRIMWVAIISVATLAFIVFIITGNLPDDWFMGIRQVILGFLLMTESSILIEYFLQKTYPISRENFVKRYTHQLLISLVVAILIFSIITAVSDIPEDADYIKAMTAFAAIGLGLIIIQSLSAGLRRTLITWIKVSDELEQVKVEKMEMSYKILQDKLNPHFLFNNLSVLKSLILQKEEKPALSFIQNFSDIYRYVLERNEWITVSLEEEVNFIKKYLALHQERLGEGLEVEIQLSEATLIKEVPPLSLQVLVENALKHNITDEDQILLIKIYDVDDRLIVENNIQLKESSYSTHTGLENLISRFRHLTEKEIDITDKEQKFKVSLPLL